jgi:hypothetical protein
LNVVAKIPLAQKASSLASHVVFGSFAAYILFESFGGKYLIAVLGVLILSAVLLSLSLRSKSTGLFSLSWLTMGVLLVFESLTPTNAAPGYAGLTILVFLLLASYEFARFNQRIESVLANTRVYEQNILMNLNALVRNHMLTIAKIVSLGLALCLALEYFSLGLVIISYPPGAGIAIFASAAIFLFVTVISMRSK